MFSRGNGSMPALEDEQKLAGGRCDKHNLANLLNPSRTNAIMEVRIPSVFFRQKFTRSRKRAQKKAKERQDEPIKPILKFKVLFASDYIL